MVEFGDESRRGAWSEDTKRVTVANERDRKTKMEMKLRLPYNQTWGEERENRKNGKK